MKHIAIIGAGIAGLSLAQHLKGKAQITILEKSRGVSGRMSTRYADPYQFDHGAQYFTARDERFQIFLKPFMDQGLVAEWKPRVMTLAKGEKPYKRDWFEPHYVAAPRMNELCKHLAEGQEVRIGFEVTRLERIGQQWRLHEKNGEVVEEVDIVISTAPAPQSVKLFPDGFAHYHLLQQVKMLGCYSLMLGFDQPLSLLWDAAKVKDLSIGWLAVNQSKPDRNTGYSLLVQSTHEWAEAHIDDDVKEAEIFLLKELSELLEVDVSTAQHIATHRWRYADVATPLGEPFLFDAALQLGACGDWCIAGRVEAAYLSAYAMAQQVSPLLTD